ncbi:MAG TPA: hypothetical protein VIL70_04565, partial [Chthoniobacterales bacterium]
HRHRRKPPADVASGSNRWPASGGNCFERIGRGERVRSVDYSAVPAPLAAAAVAPYPGPTRSTLFRCQDFGDIRLIL